MTQTVLGIQDGVAYEWTCPAPEVEVVPGVKWGHADSAFSPAYWLHQFDLAKGEYDRHCFLTGATLLEETVFCLLGGHGISYELNLAAYRHLKASGCLDCRDVVAVNELAAVLAEPLLLDSRTVRYRFPNRRAQFVHAALETFKSNEAPEGPLELRLWLMNLPGVGPKTASWIVRNWTDSDVVAIIDIHVHRAGLLAGIFTWGDKVDRHYFSMESRFLAFANGLGVRPSQLDGLIWAYMRDMPHVVDLALADLQVWKKPTVARSTAGRAEIHAAVS